MNIHNKTLAQFLKRKENPEVPAIKVNLYNSLEVQAVKEAITRLDGYCGFTMPDCFMVGDSLLTTHMGRENTRLETTEEQDSFIDLMLDSIADVKSAMAKYFTGANSPYLIGDLPDGSSDSKERLMTISERMLKAGADVVKLEIGSESSLENIKFLADNKIPVAAHVGYAPQKNSNRQYGQSLKETLELIKLVRLSGEYGAIAVITERISEALNQLLSDPAKNTLPVYSIFSGKARGGGQNLNVWDSVYKPGFKSLFFPPTADLPTDTYPESYTLEKIAENFHKLLKMTLEGKFPKSPVTRLSQEELLQLKAIETI